MVDTQELTGTEMVVVFTDSGERVPVELVDKFHRTGEQRYFVAQLVLKGPAGKFPSGSKVELSKVLIRGETIRTVNGSTILPRS